MSKAVEELTVFARRELARIYGEDEHRDLYVMLRAREKELFARVSEDQFSLEYLTAKLAMACLVWEYACQENALQTEGFRKLFFRQIMDGFRNPKMALFAAAFSDYYFVCGNEPTEPPGVLLAARLSSRLSLSSPGKGQPSEEASVPFSLQILLETLEGFRTSFENLCLEAFVPHYGKTD